jgi:hypothetical protein
MTVTRLRNCVDTFADEGHVTENFGKAGLLRLDNAGTDEKQAYLSFAGGPRPGVYVIEATLQLHARGATFNGSQTITVDAITEPWKERTLTWRTKPDVDTTDAASLAVTTMATRSQIEIDVTDMVRTAYLGTGVAFYGFHVAGANGVVSSSEAEDPDLRPQLIIEYTELPAAAYDLVPGDSDVVSIGKWVQRWSYFDPEEGEQLAYQLQMSTTGLLSGIAGSAFAATVYDSGLVASSDPELDLSTSTYVGLANAGTVYAHVRVQNAAGQIGPYSDPVAISRQIKGSLTINAPTTEIEETTPTISTTLNGRDQRSLEYIIDRLEGEITEDDVEGWGDEGWGGPWGGGTTQSITSLIDQLPIYEKPRFKALTDDGDDYQFDLPTKVIRHRTASYRLTVRSWDTVTNRVSTPGDKSYVEATRVFSWVDPAAAPTSPASLVGVTDGPGLALTWTRAAVPDYYLIVIDGEDALGYIDGLDAQISGTNYGVTYYGLEPGTEAGVEVIAVVISSGVAKTSKNNPTVDVTTDVEAIWLADRSLGTSDDPATLVRLIGQDAAPAQIGQDAEELTAVGRQDTITIIDNVRGYEGELSGYIEGRDDRLVLENWKSRPALELRLVMGDLNIPVRIGEIAIGRVPIERGLYPVVIEVRQSGESPIAARG